MSIIVVGLNHKTADVALREQVAYAESEITQALQALSRASGVNGVVILSTCNRTEWICHMANDDSHQLSKTLAELRGVPYETLEQIIYTHTNEEAIRHIMSVSCGLDSMVLGEPQILGQMKSAYRYSKQVGCLSTLIERLFQHTFAVAKQVRSETAIGENALSVALASVKLAKHIFSDISTSTALLVGAGDTIERVAFHLAEQQVSRLYIANRTLARAESLVEKLKGKIEDLNAIALVDMPMALKRADIVFSSTASSLPILGKGMVERTLNEGKHRPMFMVDLAVPRDIEPEVSELPDVYLYTIDDIEAVVAENKNNRALASRQASAIIDAQVIQFTNWWRSLDAVNLIRQYRDKMEGVKDEVLSRATSKLEQGEPADEVLRWLTRNLLNKVMHSPCHMMRKASGEGQTEILESAQQLLGLQGDD